jgi:hypothetical protein
MFDFEKRISQYIALRDRVKQLKEKHNAELKPYQEAMELLEGALLTNLNASNQESSKTKAGTAFITTERSATIADGASFRRYVIGGSLWDMVDWRANRTEVAKLVTETGSPPPGVNYAVRRTVQVRRPSNGE